MSYTYQDNILDFDSFRSNELQFIKRQIIKIINHWQTMDQNSQDYKFLYQSPYSEYDKVKEIADYIISHFKQVIIIGIGGSILNPKLTTSLQHFYGNRLELKYLDTTDPYYYQEAIKFIDLNHAYFLVISKSGETIETISLLGAILHEFEIQKININGSKFCFITDNTKNSLRQIAQSINALILNHDDKLGGRYATFTNVGILPGLLAGLDMKSFLKGADTVLKSLWELRENSFPAQAATSILLFKKPIIVNISYLTVLTDYMNWNEQIVSESLGKDGKGFTPIKNLGPKDQHSMFQLYLAGPTDKAFTFIYNNKTNEITQRISFKNNIASTSLFNKTLSCINQTELDIMIAYYKSQNFPVRQIILNDLNEECLGGLAMHSALEVILLGHLMQVNPFDQPNIEKIKIEINKNF